MVATNPQTNPEITNAGNSKSEFTPPIDAGSICSNPKKSLVIK